MFVKLSNTEIHKVKSKMNTIIVEIQSAQGFLENDGDRRGSGLELWADLRGELHRVECW